jgi:uncharacterized membrane protein YiaA
MNIWLHILLQILLQVAGIIYISTIVFPTKRNYSQEDPETVFWACWCIQFLGILLFLIGSWLYLVNKEQMFLFLVMLDKKMNFLNLICCLSVRDNRRDARINNEKNHWCWFLAFTALGVAVLLLLEILIFALGWFDYVLLILWLPKFLMILLKFKYGRWALFILHGWIFLPLVLFLLIPDTKYLY